MKILGVDPGLTTGVALIEWDGHHQPVQTEADLFDQVAFYDVPCRVWDLVHDADIVAVEHFTISGRTLQASRQYEALYVIGQFIGECRRQDKFIRQQSVATAKNAYGNARLTSLGWKVPGKHAKDALRHALLATHTARLYSLVHDPRARPWHKD